MEKGIKRRKIIGIMAAILLFLAGGYVGYLHYLKLPEKDVTDLRQEYPVVKRDYAGVSLSVVREDYPTVVLCRLQAVLTANKKEDQERYAMVTERCLRGEMKEKEFILCTNGLPKEEADTCYLLFLEKMPPEWNIENGYSAPEEWIYYVTEDNLLLSCYTSELWKQKNQWNPARFDGCSVHHFMKYVEWII